ncbi:MAG: chlorite dismutase family protein [Planctomycetota bacterium]
MSTPIQRQVVSFVAYKLDPAFRRLDDKQAALEEFASVAETPIDGLILNTYSTVGLKLDTDLMFWRIGKTGTDPVQQHAAALNKTTLAGYLHQTHSFLSMTKRSQYIDKVDPFHTEESRVNLIPGKRRYIFVYPFVKTREWYLASKEDRQAVMDEHIKVGNKYPSVKLNTTYSFGLDDQDFVVAFESDEPKDFLDLVQELRETQGSLYTVRDTPIITGVRMPVAEVLSQLA